MGITMTKLKIVVGFMAIVAALTIATSVARASVVLVKYDAAAAGAGVEPDEVSPAWTFFGSSPSAAMSNNGT